MKLHSTYLVIFILFCVFISTNAHAQAPTITSFSPYYGKTGDSITINGTGFTSTTSVKFDGTGAAGFKIISDNVIKAKIANGASGSISVTKSTGTASLSGFIYCGALNSPPTFKTPILNVSCGSTYTYTINKIANATEYVWYLNRGANAKATITHINPLGENDTSIQVTFQTGFTKDSICVKPANLCLQGFLGKTIPVGTYTPPTIDTIVSNTNNLTPCIGDVVIYTASAPAPNTAQCAITKYRWTAIPANTTIVSATTDSASISIRYDLNFTGGSISVKGISGCGYLSTSAKSVTLGYYPPAVTSITAGSGTFNVCPDYRETYTVKTGSPVVGQRSAQRYSWTIPAYTSIESADADSSSIILKILTGFTTSNLSVSGVTACNVKGTPKINSMPLNTGCIAAPDTIYGPQELCNYFVDYTSSVPIDYYVDTVPGADYYTWILPTGVTTQVDPTNTTNQITVYVDNTLNSNYGGGRLYCAAVNIRGIDRVTVSGYAELRLFRTVPIQGNISGPTSICSYIGRDTIITYEIAKVNNITQYLWETPAGVEVISGIDSNKLRVKFNQDFVSGTSIKLNAYANCGSVSPKSLTFYRPLITTPAAIRKTFTPLVSAITNVAGLITDTLRIRKVTNATNYTWSLKRGTKASITHLHGLGVNDTAIVVNIQSGFTLDTVAVAAATDCNTSGSISVALSAMALPPSVNAISGNLSSCIGDIVTYTASAPVPTSTQAPIALYKWTIPANTQIISTNGADSTTIQLKYNVGYSGGFISARSVSPSGVLSSVAYKITLKYATVTVTGITSSTSSLNACIGDDITYTATIPATLSSSQAPIVKYVWSKPNNTSIIGNIDSPSIILHFNTGYIGGSLTAKGQTACGVFGTSKLANLTHTGCALGLKNGVTQSPNSSQSNQVLMNEADIILFPNPSSESFNLNMNSVSHEVILIRVLDLQGRLMNSMQMNSNEIKKIGKELKSGTYFMELTQGKTKRIIKAIKL